MDLGGVREDQRFTLRAEWSPHHIELGATWLEGEGLDEIYSGDGFSWEAIRDQESFLYNRPDPREHGKLRGFTQGTTFEDTYTPESIARVVRESLGPSQPTEDTKVRALRTTYTDRQDFLDTVLAVIDHLRETLERGKPEAFWDESEPKSEPDAEDALVFPMRSVLELKNIDLYQQKTCRSGDLDLWLTGFSPQGQRFTLALELKKADSRNVRSGLTNQLTTYIEELASDFGIYGVLWYKGQKFDEPKNMTKSQLLSELENIKPSSVDAIRCFDVAYRTPASKV